MAICADNLPNMFLGKDAKKPPKRFLVAMLQYAFDRIDRIRLGVEFFKFGIPEQGPKI